MKGLSMLLRLLCAAALTIGIGGVAAFNGGSARAAGYETHAVVANPYLGLRNYVSNLLRHGFSPADITDRGSDRLIDALVLHGTPQTIATGLTAHLKAGADHVAVQVLAGPGHDPMPCYRQLARAFSGTSVSARNPVNGVRPP